VLFCYPVTATSENWPHEGLILVIAEALDKMDAGAGWQLWPPSVQPETRRTLMRYPALCTKIETFLNACAKLPRADRLLVREALDDQSHVQELFEGFRPAIIRSALPSPVQDSAKELFKKAFEVLVPTGVRDRSYATIYQGVDHAICPFCGCEYFDSPDGTREDLDHYLALDHYPFAGVNLNNLVPMGGKCNSRNKLAKDILRDEGKRRRRCFDPYRPSVVSIDLRQTLLFDRRGNLPNWVVELHGDQERIQTWDCVFNVRSRFVNDHLDSVYKLCLKVFRRRIIQRQSAGRPLDPLAVLVTLRELSSEKGWADRAFLERAVYEMLHARCVEGHVEFQRLLAATLQSIS
jgi:hypothetical protein